MLRWIKSHRLRTAIFVALSILAIFVAVSIIFHLTSEICGKDEYSGQKNCATYNVVLVALWHIVKAMNDFGIAITAIATVAVAAFTLTLWSVGKKSADAAKAAADALPVVERAYVYPETLH